MPPVCWMHEAPKNVYVQPEKYNCDLIIPTIWDGNHPVEHFQHEMILNAVYHDYYGAPVQAGENRYPRRLRSSDRRAEAVTFIGHNVSKYVVNIHHGLIAVAPELSGKQ